MQIDILNPTPTGGFTEQPRSEDTLRFIAVQQPYGVPLLTVKLDGTVTQSGELQATAKSLRGDMFTIQGARDDACSVIPYRALAIPPGYYHQEERD